MSMADVILAQNRVLKPIATYTHTINKEVAISAVDVDTDTFTSVSHGLAAGDRLYPMLNVDSGIVYLPDILTGGITKNTAHYVIADGLTEDAFKLSATSGGAAINLTANANQDLTKWHFEIQNGSVFQITNLPPSYRYKVKICGRCMGGWGQGYVLPNSLGQEQVYLVGVDTAFSRYSNTLASGDVFLDLLSEIDFTDNLFLRYTGMSVKSNTTSANASSVIDIKCCTLKYRSTLITAINLTSFPFANGAVVEVYRA